MRFLSDSNCLSAFGSKINIEPNTKPIQVIIQKFEESNDDYI